MANYIEDFNSKLDWAMPFQRTGKFPLDRSSMFDSYEDAVYERTVLIEEPAQLSSELFNGVNSVGVCGATSTPFWLMEQVAREIEKY